MAAQFVSNDPAEAAAAAQKLCDMGFDMVELNFSCPSHRHTKKGSAAR